MRVHFGPLAATLVSGYSVVGGALTPVISGPTTTVGCGEVVTFDGSASTAPAGRPICT